MLPVLDQLFGTFHLPRGRWPDAYGLQTPISPGLGGQLLDPLGPRPKAND